VEVPNKGHVERRHKLLPRLDGGGGSAVPGGNAEAGG
jgi:hypothetical protein